MKTFDNELKKSPSEQFSLRPAVPHVRYSPAGYRYSCCRRIVGLADKHRRWCTVRCTCGPVGNPQEILRRSAHFCPHIFATHRSPGSERIVRHVVSVGGRPQTAEEPPGCKSPTLYSSLTCERSGDIEKSRGGRGVVKRAPVPPRSHLNYLMCRHLLLSVFIHSSVRVKFWIFFTVKRLFYYRAVSNSSTAAREFG